jgi:hypothetical protein
MDHQPNGRQNGDRNGAPLTLGATNVDIVFLCAAGA